jgi:uncharacterized protein YdiU (UPF0061 family)
MYRASPAFIPRNHLVAAALDAAQSADDFQPFHRLVEVLERPHEYNSELAAYARPPLPEEVVTTTFCGT